MREGATCQQMSRDEIREFFFVEGLIRLDETPCNAFDPSVEITSDRWAEFAEYADIDPRLEPMAVLENLQCSCHLSEVGASSPHSSKADQQDTGEPRTNMLVRFAHEGELHCPLASPVAIR